MPESCRTKRTCKGWNSSLSSIAATWKHDCGKQIRAWGDCWSNYYRLGLVFSSLFSFPLYTSTFPSVYKRPVKNESFRTDKTHGPCLFLVPGTTGTARNKDGRSHGWIEIAGEGDGEEVFPHFLTKQFHRWSQQSFCSPLSNANPRSETVHVCWRTLAPFI